MKRRLLAWQIGLLLAAASTALIAYPAPAETPAQTPEQAAASKTDRRAEQAKPKTLQAVIVTAERREQNLQDVPSSVTALDAAQINRRGLNNVSDLSAVAPNLIVQSSPGGYLQAQIGIRGAAQVNPAMYFETPVPIYVDGLYYGKSAGAVFDLVDVERIEVLHGPQGTLFGRNAYAGAINFITHKPTGVFNGRSELTLGNYNGRLGKVAVDLPAIGKLKASVGGRIERRDGWFTTTPGSSVSHMNNVHKQSEFVDLLLDATPDLSINYRFDHHDVNQASRFGQVTRSDLEQVFGIPGVNPVSGRQMTGGVDAPINETLKMDGHALHASWKLGDFGTLKYIYGHRRMKYTQALELDGTILPIAATQYVPATYVQVSNELQWLGQAGPLDWVVGLYGYRDHGLTIQTQQFFFNTLIYNSQYGFAVNAKALYGQADYKLTDRLTLTAGARRDIEHRTGYRFELSNGVANVPPGTQAETSAGAFTPEKKRSFEVGTKSTLLGGKLRINADLFYERNSDLQEAVFTAKGSLSQDLVNVGKSHDQGLELEAEALVSRDLSLRLDYSYLKEKYDTFMERGENVADNRATIFAPRHTVGLVADATLARPAIGNWHAMADYRFSSGYYQYPYQLRLVDPAMQQAGNSRIPAGGMLNARVELAEMQWGHDVDGTIAFWVHNLTNSDRLTAPMDFGPSFANLALGYPTDPRTYGVSLIANW